MRDWLRLVIVIVLLTGVSFGAGLWTARRAVPSSLADLQDATWLAAELRLDPDQVAQLHEIATAYEGPLEELCARHCAARHALAEQLSTTAPSDGSQRALLEEMGRVQIETDTLILARIGALRNVLTPPQQEQFDHHLKQTLQTACPHKLHHSGWGHSNE